MAEKPHFGKNLQEQLKKLGIAIVYLYGSEAVHLSNPLSDIDVGVVMRNPKKQLSNRKDRYALHAKLTDLIAPLFTASQSREMDLVFLQTASPVLQFEAINAGCPLFSAEAIFQADYEAGVMRAYLDIRPLVETHFQAAIERAA
jgi:predicted nucleotidyltransferase